MAKKLYTPDKYKVNEYLTIENFKLDRSNAIYKNDRKYYKFKGQINRSKVEGLYNQKTGDIYALKRVK